MKLNLIVAGYGFYTLGDKNCLGGTIAPSIISWKSLSNSRNVKVTFVVRSKSSFIRAKKRLKIFKTLQTEDFSSEILTYDQLDENSRFDLGIIATPEISHKDVFEKLSKHTKKIICVKPVGNNLQTYFDILKIQATSKASFFVDFHKRFDQTNIEFIRNVTLSKATSGWFSFFYGQKEIMPKLYFKNWSEKSNPFQYLAPHYLDIIFKCISGLKISVNELDIKTISDKFDFSDQQTLSSLVSTRIKIKHPKGVFIVDAVCNWMEPKYSPYTSRQRIEFQSEGCHIISEQDNRGMQIINDESFKIPNPHFMTHNNSNIFNF